MNNHLKFNQFINEIRELEQRENIENPNRQSSEHIHNCNLLFELLEYYKANKKYYRGLNLVDVSRQLNSEPRYTTIDEFLGGTVDSSFDNQTNPENSTNIDMMKSFDDIFLEQTSNETSKSVSITLSDSGDDDDDDADTLFSSIFQDIPRPILEDEQIVGDMLHHAFNKYMMLISVRDYDILPRDEQAQIQAQSNFEQEDFKTMVENMQRQLVQ